MESPHTGPPNFISSDPLQRESTGDQWFHRTQGQWCHQLLNDKLDNSNIILVSWIFDSLAYPLFVQQLVWTNMKEDIKASALLWWGLEQMETQHTGPAMWKPFIKHQRFTSQSNNTVSHYWSSVRESASEQWIRRTAKHKSYNSMIITLVFVLHNSQNSRSVYSWYAGLFIPSISEIVFTISMCISMTYAYACAIRITVLYMCI